MRRSFRRRRMTATSISQKTMSAEMNRCQLRSVASFRRGVLSRVLWGRGAHMWGNGAFEPRAAAVQAADPAPPVVLAVAGSDSGGGAGIQADLKTFAAHRVFGTTVITAVTAQNTVQVDGIAPVPTAFVAAQLEAVLEDLPVRAVKTGMLATAATVALLAEYAERLPHLVVDPVLVSSDGYPLFDGRTQRAYLELLFPHPSVVTPNAREAGMLLGRPVSTLDEAVAAAETLAAETGVRCVVVKGGGHGVC